MIKYESVAAEKYYEEFRRVASKHDGRKMPSWERLPQVNRDIHIEVCRIWIMVDVINPLNLTALDEK